MTIAFLLLGAILPEHMFRHDVEIADQGPFKLCVHLLFYPPVSLSVYTCLPAAAMVFYGKLFWATFATYPMQWLWALAEVEANCALVISIFVRLCVLL